MTSKNNVKIINDIDDDKSGIFRLLLSGKYLGRKGDDIFGRDENYYRSANTSLNGLKLFRKIFFLLKTEFRPLVIVRNTPKDIFDRTIGILIDEFETIIENKGNLRQAIQNKINILREENFKTMDLDNKTIKMTPNELLNEFKRLRQEKILFFDAILNEYKNRNQKEKDISGWND